MNNKNLLFLEGRARIILTEWVPIGAHFVYTLQAKLGCHHPPSMGNHAPNLSEAPPPEGQFYITGDIDREPNAAVIEVGTSEVRMRVMEYRHMEYIRLECRINIESTGADIQQEHIGIEISRDGRVSYGIELDGAYSLDDIAHIIADLIDDTSVVMNTLFNAYQRRLLEVVFCNESRHRDKSIVVMADEIRTSDRPLTTMKEVLDESRYRAELAQVLGPLDPGNAHKLGERDFLLTGENGMLLIGNETSELQNVLLACSLMNSSNMFITNVRGRVSWSWDCLEEQERRIRNQETKALMDIQTQLSELSAEQVLLLSVPSHLRRDKRRIVEWMENRNMSETAKERGLGIYGYIRSLFDNLDERLVTAEEAISTLGEEIQNIRHLSSSLSEKETYHINTAMRVLTVFSVIFLPLSLIAGIYGMNFQAYRDPAVMMVSRWNMPELYWVFGYPFALGLMIVVAFILVLYFRRKGLLGSGQRTPRP